MKLFPSGEGDHIVTAFLKVYCLESKFHRMFSAQCLGDGRGFLGEINMRGYLM